MAIKSEKIYLYGRHALLEALGAAPQIIKKVFLAETIGNDIRAELAKTNIPVAALKESDTQAVARASHQGVIAVIDPSNLMHSLDAFLKEYTVQKNSCFVLLDELQDPHNVGAIIRSAAAFGAAAVLMPEHNQAPITGAVIKTSAGMAFKIPLISITNVNQTVRTLKEKGFWVYGLAMAGEKELTQEHFDAPTLFIVGNESEGIRQKTLELCDVRLSIPMHAKTESLNAAVATSVVLYQWSVQHPPNR